MYKDFYFYFYFLQIQNSAIFRILINKCSMRHKKSIHKPTYSDLNRHCLSAIAHYCFTLDSTCFQKEKEKES